MRVVSWLRHEYSIGGLDEMVAADICHNLCTRHNRSMQLLLQLVQLLAMVSIRLSRLDNTKCFIAWRDPHVNRGSLR